MMNDDNETGLEEQQEHEHPEERHEQHLDDDNDGRDHAEERHGPAVQLRNGRNSAPARDCAAGGCGITRVVAPPRRPAVSVPVAPLANERRPIHAAKAT